jgi:hypothetical protein
MGLINNYLGTLKVVGGAQTQRFLQQKKFNYRLGENAFSFGSYVSLPQGFQDPYKARIPSIKQSDYIRAVLIGVGDLINSGITVPMVMSATVSGEGTLSPDAEVGKTMAATVVGEGNFSGDARMIVSLAATVDAGARPSAFDIMQEVWQAKASGFPDPTTMGGKVNAAGTAGDPWSADLSSYPPGTAGNILYSMDPQALADAIMNDPKMLTVAKFLGLK